MKTGLTKSLMRAKNGRSVGQQSAAFAMTLRSNCRRAWAEPVPPSGRARCGSHSARRRTGAFHKSPDLARVLSAGRCFYPAHHVHAPRPPGGAPLGGVLRVEAAGNNQAKMRSGAEEGAARLCPVKAKPGTADCRGG